MIGLGTLFVYIPILLLSGWKSILANSWVEALPFEEFISEYPCYVWRMQGNLIGWEDFGGVIIFAIWGYSLYVLKKNKFENWKTSAAFKNDFTVSGIRFFIISVLIISILPLSVLPFQRVLPFDRIWHYKSLFEGVLLAVFFVRMLQLIPQKWRKLLWGLLMIAYVYQPMQATYQYITDKQSVYYQFPAFLQQVVQKKVSTAYVTEDVYNVFLRFYAQQAKKKIDIEVVKPKNSYDILILRKADIFPLSLNRDHYRMFYEDDYVHAYQHHHLKMKE